ncbi:MAG: hypothetical protein AAF708_03135 [Deinococcota bacterium]
MRFINLIMGWNYRLVITVALIIASLLNLGMAIGTTEQVWQGQFNDVMLAQESGLTLVDFPYKITDDFDLSQVATVGYADQEVSVDSTNPIIPVYADGSGIIGGRVFLQNAEGYIVASDVMHPALRNSIIFSFANTVRANVIGIFYFDIIEDDALWLEIYQDIDNHPNFAQALAILETLPPFGPSTINDYNAFIALTSEMSRDLLEKFTDLDLGVTNDTSPLSTQAVLDGFREDLPITQDDGGTYKNGNDSGLSRLEAAVNHDSLEPHPFSKSLSCPANIPICIRSVRTS